MNYVYDLAGGRIIFKDMHLLHYVLSCLFVIGFVGCVACQPTSKITRKQESVASVEQADAVGQHEAEQAQKTKNLVIQDEGKTMKNVTFSVKTRRDFRVIEDRFLQALEEGATQFTLFFESDLPHGRSIRLIDPSAKISIIIKGNDQKITSVGGILLHAKAANITIKNLSFNGAMAEFSPIVLSASHQIEIDGLIIRRYGIDAMTYKSFPLMQVKALNDHLQVHVERLAFLDNSFRGILLQIAGDQKGHWVKSVLMDKLFFVDNHATTSAIELDAFSTAHLQHFISSHSGNVAFMRLGKGDLSITQGAILHVAQCIVPIRPQSDEWRIVEARDLFVEKNDHTNADVKELLPTGSYRDEDMLMSGTPNSDEVHQKLIAGNWAWNKHVEVE